MVKGYHNGIKSQADYFLVMVSMYGCMKEQTSEAIEKKYETIMERQQLLLNLDELGDALDKLIAFFEESPFLKSCGYHSDRSMGSW